MLGKAVRISFSPVLSQLMCVLNARFCSSYIRTMLSAMMSSVPSRTRGAPNGTREMAVYYPAVINRPRWPWRQPPALEGMLRKLALRRFCIVAMSLYVGSAVIRGGSGYGHPEIIYSMVRAETTMSVVVYEGLMGSWWL
jgi:hypothetical protein